MRMKLIGPGGQRWLRLLHLCSAALWIGCAVAIFARNLTLKASDGRELYGLLATMDFIDLGVLVPGAVGCFLTGLVYSVWTHWGWFKHRWIAIKWAICVFSIGFGTYPLGPWLSEQVTLAKEHGMAALSHPTFQHHRLMTLVFGAFQVSLLATTCVLTVFKPWRHRRPERESAGAQDTAATESPADRVVHP